jgi:hypothetical protein
MRRRYCHPRHPAVLSIPHTAASAPDMMSRREQPAKLAVLLMTDRAHALMVADQRDVSMTAGGHPCWPSAGSAIGH